MRLNPLVPVAAGWLAGIGARLGAPAEADWTAAIGAALVAAAGAAYIGGRRVAAFTLAAGIAGAAWAGATRPSLEPPHVAAWTGREVALSGWVADEPWVRGNQASYRLAVEEVGERGQSSHATGRILLQTTAFPPLAYGQSLVATGTLEEPPAFEGFDYRAYLARRGVYAVMRRPRLERLPDQRGHAVRRGLLAVKARARRGLESSIPEPEASLGVGILLGDSRGIPEHVDDAFRRTNTSHVIAISGSNIALLVAVLMSTVGSVLGPRRAVPVVLVTLVTYTALVGADAAVVRAALMGGVTVVGILLRRPGEAATGLMAAAAVMTAFRPDYVFDLGFQLSFAATVGLVLYSRRLGDALVVGMHLDVATARGRRVVAVAQEVLLVTAAAQLTTWPLIAYHVGEVSLVGLAANALILPAQPPIMGLTAVAALAGMIGPAPGAVVGALAWLPLAYTIRVVEAMAGLPAASVPFSLSGAGLVGYYGVLAAGLLGGRPVVDKMRSVRVALGAKRSMPSPVDAPDHRRPLAAAAGVLGSWQPGAKTLGAAAVACTLVWTGAATAPDGWLHVAVLDVGQGDAILVTTPTGRRMLVDAGPEPQAVLDALGRRTAPWRRGLDAAVLTHPDSDHVGGLASVVTRHRLGLMIDPGLDGASAQASAWRAALAATGVQRTVLGAGSRIVLDDIAGVVADVIWPPPGGSPLITDKPNNGSVVLRLRYGEVSVLLTGDIESEVELALADGRADLRADVLKVAHHGSATSTTPRFLAAVSPAAAVISAGRDNPFGHPVPEVLERLEVVPVWRTDRDGTVELITDGRTIWMKPPGPGRAATVGVPARPPAAEPR